MDKILSLSIVIPIYNEEKALKSFLPKLKAFVEENPFILILVNDGSKDKSKEMITEIANGENIILVNNKINKGYGGAIKVGINAANTSHVITIDGDGQHQLSDILKMVKICNVSDADMVVGQRKANSSGWYRQLGKSIIKSFAKLLMTIPINDLNSGMKLYNTELAKKYLPLCPDNMAYSDTITLVFINQRHLVIETPILVLERDGGESTINTFTAFETIKQILNNIILFNPMKVFFPLSLFSILISIFWGIPFLLMGNGVSVGAMLGLVTGFLLFVLGLLAEQLSMIRKNLIK
jgi:glycosyltransferase involved in cell wall biosynthesis